MADELFFNVRLEGTTQFRSVTHDADVLTNIATVVLIEGGLTGWKDDPYRSKVITEFREGDVEDQCVERQFATDEQLCSYLESTIADLQAKKFEVVRYKVNGLPIDWLNRINLPPD